MQNGLMSVADAGENMNPDEQLTITDQGKTWKLVKFDGSPMLAKELVKGSNYHIIPDVPSPGLATIIMEGDHGI